MSDNELLLAITEIMDNKLKPLREDIKTLNEVVSNLDERMKKVEINQENRILPGLQNIEACYTSTYERYANGVKQIENTVQDIGLMKKVITEHSIKLEKIS